MFHVDESVGLYSTRVVSTALALQERSVEFLSVFEVVRLESDGSALYRPDVAERMQFVTRSRRIVVMGCVKGVEVEIRSPDIHNPVCNSWRSHSPRA